MSLKDKVIFMSGGSRGIGLSIALRAAQDGAKVVIAAKTVDPPPKLEGVDSDDRYKNTLNNRKEQIGGTQQKPQWIVRQGLLSHLQ